MAQEKELSAAERMHKLNCELKRQNKIVGFTEKTNKDGTRDKIPIVERVK